MKFVEISFLYFILCILALRSVASSLEYDRIGQKRHFSSPIHTQPLLTFLPGPHPIPIPFPFILH